ncbi:hypothetical protein OPQ81_009569 [Rhizoctonia solani]|nr:hypothetical protein OPQ81_009569 [Rhizoctonia solani]
MSICDPSNYNFGYSSSAYRTTAKVTQYHNDTLSCQSFLTKKLNLPLFFASDSAFSSKHETHHMLIAMA